MMLVFVAIGLGVYSFVSPWPGIPLFALTVGLLVGVCRFSERIAAAPPKELTFEGLNTIRDLCYAIVDDGDVPRPPSAGRSPSANEITGSIG